MALILRRSRLSSGRTCNTCVASACTRTRLHLRRQLHDQAAADAADGADGAVPPPQPPPTQQPMAAFRELDGSSESPAPEAQLW